MPTPWMVCGPSKNSISVRSREAEPDVKVPDFGEFVGHPGVRGDAVEVAAFDHERPGRDEGGHFGVVEGIAEVELGHFVFAGVRGRSRASRVVTFFRIHSLKSAEQIERAVAVEHGGHAHGRLAAVAQAVEADALRIDEGLVGEPVEDAVVLADDDGEEAFLRGLALRWRTRKRSPPRYGLCGANTTKPRSARRAAKDL